MNSIKINASKKYDVYVGPGLLDSAGGLIRTVSSAGTAFIVSDDVVFSLYGEKLTSSLKKEGFRVESYVFEHGESSKNLSTYSLILEKMCEKHITRKDVVVALGGGVTGDVAGFTAATYQRGMDFVQIPTTLLAAVDSSVGGKTGVNLPNGKNQVGCFHQPSIVICDTALLDTIPESEYVNGCAEIIKYAVIASRQLFTEICKKPVKEQYESVIAECVSIKRDFVEKDEFDIGYRMMLNFGHTAGHAIETVSGYAVPHGLAVATGMMIMARAAAEKGYCDEETVREIGRALEKYSLPVSTDYSAEELCGVILSDKKTKNGSITLVVPESVGRCVLLETETSEILEWLKSGGVK